jgi:hypothetical protein
MNTFATLRRTYQHAERNGQCPAVADAASEAIDPRHHKHVAMAQEIQHGAKLIAVISCCAAALLRADKLATGGRQGPS